MSRIALGLACGRPQLRGSRSEAGLAKLLAGWRDDTAAFAAAGDDLLVSRS